MIRLPRQRLVLLAVLVAGCASAGKRLEQGIEAEAEGSYYEAAIRYIEALEKDETLAEARGRLLEASASAVAVGLDEAAASQMAGDPVRAAEAFRALDRLIGRARRVGVSVPVPTGFTQERRATLDDAITTLMERSEASAERGRWREARQALGRVRRDFEPSVEQREASERAEAFLLLAWAESEERDRRHRRAFFLAGEVLALVRPAPADLIDRVEALRERAISNGTQAIAVFPVTMTAPVREQMEGDLDQELADLLELVYWRAPPPFVVVRDPVVVRQVLRRRGPPRASFRPVRVMAEVGADFGVMVELTGLRATERNVSQENHQARTRDGLITSFIEERGTVNYRVEAEVTIMDDRGRIVAETTERATTRGRFERGVYEGDYRDLDLSRGESRLFNRVVIRRRLAEIQRGLVSNLSDRVAEEVFDRVLARIP